MCFAGGAFEVSVLVEDRLTHGWLAETKIRTFCSPILPVVALTLKPCCIFVTAGLKKIGSSVTSMLLKSLPQPVKPVNPSLLHSNHFKFKEGRSSSIFWGYFQFCLSKALHSLCKTLSDIVLADLHKTQECVGNFVCVYVRGLQLPSKGRGLLDWSIQSKWHPVAGKGYNCFGSIPCQKAFQTP